MVKKIILSFISVILLHFFTSASSDEGIDFEGMIVYEKASLSDTVVLNLYFKGNKVRIDEFDKHGKLLEYKILDFDKKEITTINPERKLYVRSAILTDKIPIGSEIGIDKTANYKYVNNRKVYQWIVKNKTRNSVVSYWVTEEKYDYFKNIFAYLNESDKISSFYTHIPDTGGFIPLIAEERSLVRVPRMSLRALKITENKVNDNLFIIPGDYKVFD